MSKVDICCYDRVRLKDGREGTIVDIFVNPSDLDKYYEDTVLHIEFYDSEHKYERPKGEDKESDWFLDEVKPCDVVEITYRPNY